MACHYDESSECAHVSMNEVARYRTERTLVGLQKGVGASHQYSRVNEKRIGWGEVVTGIVVDLAIGAHSSRASWAHSQVAIFRRPISTLLGHCMKVKRHETPLSRANFTLKSKTTTLELNVIARGQSKESQAWRWTSYGNNHGDWRRAVQQAAIRIGRVWRVSFLFSFNFPNGSPIIMWAAE